ncbi:MAG: hypothetical protein Q8R38_08385 [Candidatus Omnitrophota bacterium]|nr:hypothetical protein [Candidatus Omnitrophota bacterium]
MKKFVVLVAAVLCVILAGSAFAVPQHEQMSTKQIMVDRNGDAKIDGVDIYDVDNKVVKRGYDTDNDMVVDKWETYDENTGMPIVTASDEAFELR